MCLQKFYVYDSVAIIVRFNLHLIFFIYLGKYVLPLPTYLGNINQFIIKTGNFFIVLKITLKVSYQARLCLIRNFLF